MRSIKSELFTRIIALAVLIVLNSCNGLMDSKLYHKDRFPPDNSWKVTISQGAWGNVWFWEGDFMPSTDGSWGKITPVVRVVYVYKLTSLHQVDQFSYSPFYREIYTDMVDSLWSDRSGFFEINLEPGRYSFFIKEDSLYYANLFDSELNILPATVDNDTVTKVQIDITYKATF
jgi:hypothetical protein